MKNAMRIIVIVLIAVMTLSLFSVSPSAANPTTVNSVRIYTKKDNNKVDVESISLTRGPKVRYRKNKKIQTCYTGQSKSIGTITFTYYGTKPTKKNFKWTSSDKNVATVNANGSVTAIGPGTATIKVTAVDAKGNPFKVKDKEGNLVVVNDSCVVTVKKEAHDAYYYLNAYRKKAKVGTLKKDAKLEKIAKIRAEEISKKFSHTRPNGKSCLSLIKGNKYKGENIARGYVISESVSKGWYKSKGHRKNMLRKEFKKVGIATFKKGGKVYWVQVFSS